VLSISGKKSKIKFELPKKGDIPYSKANIDLAKKELGFFPKISLKEGLEKLLKSN
jgi:nucleoside-diphosphate-sugar epimerase